MIELIIEIFEREVEHYMNLYKILYNRYLMRCSIINIYFDSIFNIICHELNIPKSDENYNFINEITPLY